MITDHVLEGRGHVKKILFYAFILCFCHAFADYPTFAEEYIRCHSSPAGDEIEKIKIQSQDLYLRFNFITKPRGVRVNVIANGLPCDLTIKTQDGSEAHYM